MSNSKHTPGPWIVAPLKGKYYGTVVRIGDDEVKVWTPDHFAKPFASVREIEQGWNAAEHGHDHVEDSQSYANACLIAAAPDLLEALKGLIALCHEAGFPCDKAEEAVNKATGETK